MRSNCRLYTRTRESTAVMLSTCAKLLQWCGYCGLCSTQVPHTYSPSQLLPSHVYLASNRHRKSRSNWRLYTRAWDSTGFMLSTCDKLLQWCWYFGLCSTQVPHTYLLSQLQSSHVYLSSNSHPKVAQIDVYTLGLKNWLLSCSQRMPNCFNGGGILDYALHRYPTHIRSPNYCRRMCICQAIGPQKELKLTFIHSGWRFDWFCALNLFQTASIIKVLWSILYTGTPHIFGLPTAVIACVFVKQ